MATCTASNHSEEKVVQQLNELFGATLNFDVIKTVAVSYEYDINESCNRLLEISTQRKEASSMRMFDVGELSFALTQPSVPSPTPAAKSKKAMDIEKAIDLINQGYKVLVILRGMPGSGKSYLARKILQSTIGFDINHRLHILSADDFFYQHGSYVYDVRRIDAAHNWNQKRAFDAMSRGFSPVIIDNTNTQMWEMKPYASMATDYGYIIQILEPDTHWSFNDKELTKRNTHDVPKVKIKEMIDRFEKNVTPEKLLSAYSLVYKLQKPPQRRLYPPPDINTKTQETNKNKHVSKPTTPSEDRPKEIETIDLMEFDEIPTKASSEIINRTASPWVNANNNACVNVLQPTKIDMIIVSSDEEEPANTKSNTDPDLEKMWGVNENSLLSWDMVTPLKDDFTPEKIPELPVDNPAVDTSDFSCGTDNEYFELVRNERVTPGRYETIVVLETSNRNINQYTAPKPKSGVPKICMLDKGSMTEDTYKDYEDHISQLVGLFPAVPRTHLTYWYNKCKGDLEWTIEFLLEAKEEVTTLIDDDIADMKSVVETANQPTAPNTDSDSTDSSSGSKGAKPKKRRSKKDQRKSMESNQLKSLIESKIDIGKEHYSEKVLKVKGFKFGSPAISAEANTNEPSTSQGNRRSPVPEDFIVIDSDIEFDEVDVKNPVDEPKTPEDTIELNIGDHFVSQLENHFGDPKFPYPKGLQPVVQVPLSLARQLYTFYVESVYRQMENQNQVLETLIQEDEEFARKLQAKEQEECGGARALPVPDLRQIMEDQQASQATYKKESEKWKSLNPDNLAAKLTRQKLFSAFPTIPQETLVEILFAHDNKYEDTVDTLLASTGSENVRGRLETIREPPIQNEVLQEMKKAQRDNCNEEYEQLQEATFYRAEANKYLKRRAELFEKAQQYYQRGMTEVAQFYSGLASLQTEYSVRANGMAASAFIDEHSKRLQDFNTLDLHYLYVKEAVPALDVFLDRNINLLRHSQLKNFEHLQIITGRGKRSENGISKIRPVVQARLKARNVQFAVLNPGLLKVKISKTSMVTSEMPRPRQ